MTTDIFDERLPKRIVLSDLDSTVAETQHRFHLSPTMDPEHGSWMKFSMACYDDPPIEGSCALLRLCASLGLPIFFVSGRNVEAYQNTVAWMDLHDIPFESIRLRREGDLEHNGDYKVQHIKQLQAEGYEIVLMLEDFPDVAQQIMAETGVPVLCVNPMYKDTVMVSFAAIYEASKAAEAV